MMLRAADAGDVAELERLLDCCSGDGSLVDAMVPELYRTPLVTAAVRAHVPAVAMLLARGATVDMCDADGRTALHYAASTGSEEVSEGRSYSGDRVVSAFAQVVVVDGRTALHYAAACTESEEVGGGRGASSSSSSTHSNRATAPDPSSSVWLTGSLMPYQPTR